MVVIGTQTFAEFAGHWAHAIVTHVDIMILVTKPELP